MVPVTDDEARQWADLLDAAPLVIRMGALKLMPLPLEPAAGFGTIARRLYDPAGSGWTATVAVGRYK